jgi:hypothetical protein
MKKLILSLILVISSVLSLSAQSYYTSTKTEMYTYDNETEKWVLYQKNSDVNIVVVLEEEFVTFQAKTPTMFKIYKSTGKEISGEKFTGYRYDAVDLRKNTKCSIDVIKFSESSYMISIISGGYEYNLRYYIKTM